MYKVEGSSKKAEWFLAQNTDLPVITKDGVVIRIIEVDGWLHLMLDVSDDVSNPSTAIRNAAPLAVKWNSRLLDFQGVWRDGGLNELLEKLLYMRDHGKSYRRLAELLNHNVENHMREYLAYRREVESLQPSYEQEFDRDLYFHPFATEFQHSGLGLIKSRELLRAIGLRDNEIDKELKAGLERLRKGRKPFRRNRPVSETKIVSVLNNWKGSKSKKQSKQKNRKKTN